MNPPDGGPVQPVGTSDGDELQELRLLVPRDLVRAWQRCSWLITYETGRSRIDVMQEMVRDFLVKHGC